MEQLLVPAAVAELQADDDAVATMPPQQEEKSTMVSFAGGRVTKTPKSPASESVVSDIPGVDDDITDPVTPTEVLNTAALGALPDALHGHEALLMGFCQALQGQLRKTVFEEHKAIMRSFDDALVAMRKWLETCVTQNEHSTYQLSAAVEALAQGGQTSAPPYQVTISAVNPDGFPVTFVVSKREAGALFQTLGEIFPWLKENAYVSPGG